MSENNEFTFENPQYRKTYWHTCSHVMAQAVKRLYPEVKLAIGPSIDNGQVAMLVTKSSCTVASIFASNGLGGTPQRDTAKWPNDVQDLVITPMAESMATTNDVNVRTAPSTNSEVLMTMPTDTVVAVIGVSEDTEDGAWYEIWYNEVCAYLNAKYVKSISSAAPATSEPTTPAEPTE